MFYFLSNYDGPRTKVYDKKQGAYALLALHQISSKTWKIALTKGLGDNNYFH